MIDSPHLFFKYGKENNISEDILLEACKQYKEIYKHKIPPIFTLKHLAILSGVQYQYLRQIVARKKYPYKTFNIKKKNGGVREISIPEYLLFIVQKWVATNILKNTQSHHRSFAYNVGSSIIKCANEHCGCNWMIKTDIKNFFSSITERTVYKIFRKYGYNPLISFELTRICTKESNKKESIDVSMYHKIPYYNKVFEYRNLHIGCLPQGAPTSPVLSNLACFQMDEKIEVLANENNLIYTRYADDIILSSSEPFERTKILGIIKKLHQVLESYDLKPNLLKTKIVSPGARKIVLGLLVNSDTPKLTKEFKKKLEYHMWAISKFGFSEHQKHLKFKSALSFIEHIKGLINFSIFVEKKFGEKISKQFLEELEKQGLGLLK